LEERLAKFHISDTEGASAEGGDNQASIPCGVLASDAFVSCQNSAAAGVDNVTAICHHLATSAQSVGRNYTSTDNDQLFDNLTPVTNLPVALRRQDSSMSVDTDLDFCAINKPQKTVTETKTLLRDVARDNLMDNGQIPEFIVLSAHPREGSLAEQFWRRKASRSHRVDEFALYGDVTCTKRKPARTFSPYNREKRPDRRGRDRCSSTRKTHGTTPRPPPGLGSTSGYSNSFDSCDPYEGKSPRLGSLYIQNLC
jgi:hypothetical protein